MSPSHSNTRNRKYRYYISQAVIQCRRNEAGTISKIPAAEIENVVSQEIKDFLTNNKNIQEFLKDCNIHKQKDLLLSIKSSIDNNFIRTIINKVIIYKEKIEIVICKNQLLKMLEAIYYKKDLPEEIKEDAEVPITITKNIRISATSRNGSVLILSESGEQESKINPQLVKAVAKSYYLHNQILSGTQVKDIADSTYLKRVLELRFLSPKIIDSILNGTQTKDISL